MKNSIIVIFFIEFSGGQCVWSVPVRGAIERTLLDAVDGLRMDDNIAVLRNCLPMGRSKFRAGLEFYILIVKKKN